MMAQLVPQWWSTRATPVVSRFHHGGELVPPWWLSLCRSGGQLVPPRWSADFTMVASSCRHGGRVFPLAFTIFNLVYWLAYTLPSASDVDEEGEIPIKTD